MDNPKHRPKCAIAESVYPNSESCLTAIVNAVTMVERMASLKKVWDNKPKSRKQGYNFVRRPESLPPLCTSCVVMKATTES